MNQPTDEFESEDTMRHGPFDIVLLRGCVIVPCQQVNLEKGRIRDLEDTD